MYNIIVVSDADKMKSVVYCQQNRLKLGETIQIYMPMDLKQFNL